MKSIIVLGAGMVGSAMAIDLSADYKVTIADRDQNALDRITERYKNLEPLVLDVRDSDILKASLSQFDLVVCAVPGFLGYQTLRQIIEAGKDVVDISFFPENSLELDDLAKQKGVTAIVDCGVAPGMDNIILGRYNELLEVSHFECLVGGLPKEKKWPFNYKAPFSPVDVIEEYTRPARYVEHGEVVTREALSDCEYVYFDKLGTLESFNSDGLRSLIYTMPHIPNMKEKTLRYPGHVEYIKVLKESGFFETNSISINGTSVTPLDFTSKILFNEWKLNPDDREVTVMRVSISGKNKMGDTEHIIYDLHDEYCEDTNTASMSRTTGYTATAAANLILKGRFNQKGVFPPELVGKDKDCFGFILDYLEDRGVKYNKTTSKG